MNVKLLRTVKKHILEEPRRFRMGDWVSHDSNDMGIKAELPSCGTVACIGGWACILSGQDVMPGDWLEMSGRKALTISECQANRLFYVCEWPKRFYLRWKRAKTLRTRAYIAAERIDHFIATKGAE